jgi:hypothetical protein
VGLYHTDFNDYYHVHQQQQQQQQQPQHHHHLRDSPPADDDLDDDDDDDRRDDVISPSPLSPPSASSRPQPARSPYEWMKKPSYQSQPDKSGKSDFYLFPDLPTIRGRSYVQMLLCVFRWEPNTMHMKACCWLHRHAKYCDQMSL